MDKQAKLIVALDVETREEALRLAGLLYPTVDIFKIGSQLFTACGPDVVREVHRMGARVFLDLKFHDIPNTVAQAVASAVNNAAVLMMTVHTSGGDEMMRAAAQAAGVRAAVFNMERPKIVGVTVLTSDASGGDTKKIVVERARAAQKAGLDGVVCSVEEAAAVRKECGEDFVIVTPGIRLPQDDRSDQKRVATPRAAVEAGSNYLVVGRPIVGAKDPLATSIQILEQIKN